MTLNRHNVREVAFQTLFILDSVKDMDLNTALRQVLDLYDETEVPDYLEFLIAGVQEQRESLDADLTKHLKTGWTLQRVGRADATIMRLGLFEIKNGGAAVPDVVAVNEALQLVDQYSDPQSKKFVNAVLSHFVADETE